jgi:RHS repeat-associated protein
MESTVLPVKRDIPVKKVQVHFRSYFWPKKRIFDMLFGTKMYLSLLTSRDSAYNRVTTMTDSTGTTTYTYNPINGTVTTGAGRLASVSVPIAGSSATVTYTYDELGRVTGRGVDHATTDANDVSTTFDALGRVTNVSNPLGAFVYAYIDETSRLHTVTYPTGTGLSTTYSYFGNTGDQRLQTIQNMHSTTQLSKFDYTYNAVGTIATWTQQADSSTAVVNTLTYDNADQLTKDDITGGATNHNYYNYDPAGNRLLETTASSTTGGQFNNLNQLTGLSGSTTSTTVSGHTSAAITSATVNAVPATISGSTNFTANVSLPIGTNVVSVVAQPSSASTPVATQRYQIAVSGTPTELTYDANGNCITDENGNTYTWDALNRLTKIAYASGAYSTFAYDGLSRRTQIIEYDSTTSHNVTSTKNYVWIGSEIAEERDASNTVTKRFFPQGEQQAGTPYFYTSDHLGSVREVCNSSGTIVARYSYDPYGRTTLVSGSNLATFQYTGDYLFHQSSGLQLAVYRAYDSNTGRWLSRDPISEEGGLNLYDYVDDNPIWAIDPDGLKKCFKWFLITFYNNKSGNRATKRNPDLLNDNSAATADRRYSPNGTHQPTFDPTASSNPPYPRGTRLVVIRPNGKEDKRVIQDVGKGFAEPKPEMNLPMGVDPDEWLDLWTKNMKHATQGNPEWDLVYQVVPDNCPCQAGWSESSTIPKPHGQ